MFGNTTIRKRVMSEINTRLNEEEKKYLKQCEAIEREAATKKKEAADKIVEKMLAPFK